MGKRVNFALLSVLSAVMISLGPDAHAAPAVPQSTPIPDPACSISIASSGFKTGGGAANIKYYFVTFRRTCGYPVSAFYHANLSGLFAGTSWLYGPTVVGSSGTSELDTQSQGACTYGWRYQNSSGWHNEKLGGPGC